MSTDDRIRKRIRLPLIITGIVMIIFYLTLGGLILFKPTILPKIPNEFRIIFASLLIIYGLYRSWRLYADSK